MSENTTLQSSQFSKTSLRFDTVERHIAPDKVQNTIHSYLLAARGGQKAFLPAKRGIAYRYLGQGWSVMLFVKDPYQAPRAKRASHRRKDQAPRSHIQTPFSRHDANIADFYYTALKNGDRPAALARAQARGGYDDKELNRCLKDADKAVSLRTTAVVKHLIAKRYPGPHSRELSTIIAASPSSYCYMAQGDLAKSHDRDMKRWTMNRRIRDLIDAGILVRIGYIVIRRRVQPGGKESETGKWKDRVNVYKIKATYALVRVHTNAISSVFEPPYPGSPPEKPEHGILSRCQFIPREPP